MAIGHLSFNDQIPHGRMQRSCLNKLEQGLTELTTLLNSLAPDVMIDGDGKETAQYDYVAAKFGYPDSKTAMAGVAELKTLLEKLQGNGAVELMTSAFAKFRG